MYKSCSKFRQGFKERRGVEAGTKNSKENRKLKPVIIIRKHAVLIEQPETPIRIPKIIKLTEEEKQLKAAKKEQQQRKSQSRKIPLKPIIINEIKPFKTSGLKIVIPPRLIYKAK